MRASKAVAVLILAGSVSGCCCVIPFPGQKPKVVSVGPTVPAPARPAFRSDVAVKINSAVNRKLESGAPGSWLLCSVTVTNNTDKPLSVAPEVIGITTNAGETQFGATANFQSPDPAALRARFGREALPINGVLAPGESVTGDVVYLTTATGKPAAAGYHP